MGARFTKWRAVIRITDALPSSARVRANAHALGRYAGLCQEQLLVPIVEPEVLTDGSHTIEGCEEVTGAVLHARGLSQDDARLVPLRRTGRYTTTRSSMTGTREEMIMANALSKKERALMDAYWRAANYLSVGQRRMQPASIFVGDSEIEAYPKHGMPPPHGLTTTPQGCSPTATDLITLRLGTSMTEMSLLTPLVVKTRVWS
jgi:hypothetical protein